jgi:hypothetical protein
VLMTEYVQPRKASPVVELTLRQDT